MNCKCEGSTQRRGLKIKLNDAREGSGKAIDSSKKINVDLGAGQVVELSLDDLAERERQSPEWKAVAAGEVRVIPVEEFRLKSPPKYKNGEVDFQTKRRNEGVIEGYPMNIKVEDIEKELKDKFDGLMAKGWNDKSAADETKKKLKKKYDALQSWKDIYAEIKTKQTLHELLKHLQVPSLLVRSVENKALNALGLDLPDGEMDLLLSYVASNCLHIVLCEVKRPRVEPWESADKEPTKESIKKALKQLNSDLELVISLLPDIPGSCIIINAFTCFPDTPVSILEKLFCDTCMETTIGKEDLDDMEILRGKLMIPQVTAIASCDDKGLENLLKLNTRLVGQHSLLHKGWRETKDVGKLEAGRMNFNVKAIEKDLMGDYVFATPKQREDISKATCARFVTVKGRAGSGKTVVLLGIIQTKMKRPDKKMMILTAYRSYNEHQTDRITEYFRSKTDHLQKDELTVMGWEDLLTEFNVDRYKKTNSKGLTGDYAYKCMDSPAIISDLAEAVHERFPEHQITVAIDEMDASFAPKTKDDNDKIKNDWSAVYLPENVSLVLVFNPGSIRDPIHFSTDTPWHHVSCDQRFRSTRSITKAVDCVAEHSEMGYEHSGHPETPDTYATDVAGVKPSIVDLGVESYNSGDKRDRLLKEALQNMRTCLESEGRHDVTLLYGRYLSEQVQEILLNTALDADWQAFQSCDFCGSEADTVVYVGPGGLEPLSRARSRLFVVLVWDTKKGRRKYERFTPGFQEAVERGLMIKLDT